MTFPIVQSVTETSFSSAAANHDVVMPAAVNSGDLLIIFFACYQANTLTTPNGWTQYSTTQASGTFATGAVYAKIADGTEDGTNVNVISSAARAGAAQVYRITGWYGTLATGLEISSAYNSAGVAGTAIDNPALNPINWDVEDTLWIAVYMAGDDDVLCSAYPANYTNGVDTISGAGANLSGELGSTRRENAAASEDPGEFTLESSEARIGWTLGVRPAAAAGGNVYQINIGDAWKTINAVKINIGDAWKPVPGMKINIGDAWKTIF